MYIDRVERISSSMIKTGVFRIYLFLIGEKLYDVALRLSLRTYNGTHEPPILFIIEIFLKWIELLLILGQRWDLRE